MQIFQCCVKTNGVFLHNRGGMMNWLPKYFGKNYYNVLLVSFILIRFADAYINFVLYVQDGFYLNRSIGVLGFNWPYLFFEQLFVSLVFFVISYKEFEFIQSSLEGTFHSNSQEHIITQREDGLNVLNWAFIKRWLLYTCLRTFLIFSICSLLVGVFLKCELISMDLDVEQVKLLAIMLVLIANLFYLRRFIVQLRKAHIFA